MVNPIVLATYFNGLSGKRHPVELTVENEQVRFIGLGILKNFQRRAVRLAEPFARAPCVLDFADGSRCEIEDEAGKAAVLRALGYRKSLAQRWQEHWQGALLALILLLLALVAGYRWGLPYAAALGAPLIPLASEQKMGAFALAAFDQGGGLSPSNLPERADQTHPMGRREVEAAFRRVMPAGARLPMRLVFRAAPGIGANALALPGGTIVITDAMVALARNADQISGVLAHEIGHQQYRHSLKGLLQSSVTSAASFALFGDFSGVAAALPTLLLNLEYSRASETEADDYAIALMQANHIAPAQLASLLDSLEPQPAGDNQADLPRWMRRLGAYASSHPQSADRSRRLRGAAQ